MEVCPSVADQIYDRLTQTNADGSIEGRLAESWTVNDASDAVTFKLHEDAVWSDGEPVTAEDVVFSYQMYSDPSVEAKSRYHLEYIAGVDDSGAELSEDSIEVTADSDYEVTFKLKEAMYPDTFLQDIDTVFIIPKHIFEGKTAEEINAPDLWANPVGSGPFIYDSEINGERIPKLLNSIFSCAFSIALESILCSICSFSATPREVNTFIRRSDPNKRIRSSSREM